MYRVSDPEIIKKIKAAITDKNLTISEARASLRSSLRELYSMSAEIVKLKSKLSEHEPPCVAKETKRLIDEIADENEKINIQAG